MQSFFFSIIFVASNLPPKPVSIILISLLNLLNAIKAAAVVISKKVIGSPLFLVSISSKISTNISSDINLFLIRILSLKFIKCGDV